MADWMILKGSLYRAPCLSNKRYNPGCGPVQVGLVGHRGDEATICTSTSTPTSVTRYFAPLDPIPLSWSGASGPSIMAG